MPCLKLTATLRRKNGFNNWVVFCPYCQGNHWMPGGNYTEDPRDYLGVDTLHCGHAVELVADEKSKRRIERNAKRSAESC